MNKYTYSASLNAFFPVALKVDYEKAGSWPDDALDVSDEIATDFMDEAPVGKIRVAGKSGYPEWSDKPLPTLEEQIASAELEKQNLIDQANEYMNSKQWPGKAAIGRLKGDDLAQYNAWLDYLDALEAAKTASAPNIIWPTAPVA